MRGTLLLMLTLLTVRATAQNTLDSGQAPTSRSVAQDRIYLQIQSEGLASMVTLNELRKGRTNRVLEMHEGNLDLAIVTTWRRFETGDAEQKDRALGFLMAAKRYREEYPRKKEATLSDGELARVNAETMAQAQRVLERLDEQSNKEPKATR